MFLLLENRIIQTLILFSLSRMVMPGIVTGCPRGAVKPVIDGIVTGVKLMTNESLIPDTMPVKPGATRMSQDVFGAGRLPQGVGNLVHKMKK
jgi:hypothetical protein